MAIDLSLPADNARIVAAELRGQFTALKEELDSKLDDAYVSGAISAQAAGNCNAVENLVLTVSNPPTQAQTQALVDKLAELMNALKRQ